MLPLTKPSAGFDQIRDVMTYLDSTNCYLVNTWNIYLCFIGLKAAYDKIPKRLLFKCLDIRLGTYCIASLIQAIFIHTAVKTNNNKHFSEKNLCWQSGIESPVIQ